MTLGTDFYSHSLSGCISTPCADTQKMLLIKVGEKKNLMQQSSRELIIRDRNWKTKSVLKLFKMDVVTNLTLNFFQYHWVAASNNKLWIQSLWATTVLALQSSYIYVIFLNQNLLINSWLIFTDNSAGCISNASFIFMHMFRNIIISACIILIIIIIGIKSVLYLTKKQDGDELRAYSCCNVSDKRMFHNIKC